MANEETGKITWMYEGHTITIDAEHKRFRIDGPLIKEWVGSFDSAKQQIDEALKKHEAQTRKRVSLPVLTETGERVKLTGIHAGNGSILGLPGSGGYSTPDFYPDVPWIAEVLQNIAELSKQIKAQENRLEPYRMRRHAIKAGTHSEKVDYLVQSVEEATRKAKEGGR